MKQTHARLSEGNEVRSSRIVMSAQQSWWPSFTALLDVICIRMQLSGPMQIKYHHVSRKMRSHRMPTSPTVLGRRSWSQKLVSTITSASSCHKSAARTIDGSKLHPTGAIDIKECRPRSAMLQTRLALSELYYSHNTSSSIRSAILCLCSTRRDATSRAYTAGFGCAPCDCVSFVVLVGGVVERYLSAVQLQCTDCIVISMQVFVSVRSEVLLKRGRRDRRYCFLNGRRRLRCPLKRVQRPGLPRQV